MERRSLAFIGTTLGIVLWATSQLGVEAAMPGWRQTSQSQAAENETQNSERMAADDSDSEPAVPRLVSFSGELKGATGHVRSGLLSIQFAIYDQQYDGTALWSETQNVHLDGQGRYKVLLGTETDGGLPADLFGPGKARWLGVEPLDLGIEVPPRVLLVSVPYALKAGDAETLGGLPASAFLQADVSGSNAVGTSDRTAMQADSSGTAGKTALPARSSKSPRAQQVASTNTTNLLAKYDATNNLVPSEVFESGGTWVLGRPVRPLHFR